MGNAAFDAAKAVNLDGLAEMLGVVKGKSPCCGTAMARYTGRDGCERWMCKTCHRGGSTIDFLAAVRGYSASRAAHAVMALAPSLAMKRGAGNDDDAARSAAEEALRKLVEYRERDATVEAYLRDRGVSQRTLDEAFELGWYRTLPSSPMRARDVLLEIIGREGMEAAGMTHFGRFPAVAYRPLVFVSKSFSQAEFRSVTPLLDGSYAKAMQVGAYDAPMEAHFGTPQHATIVDGGIEMMSLMDMNFAKGAVVLGIFNQTWVDAWADSVAIAFPTVKMWFVGTSGEVEDVRAQRMIRSLQERGYDAHRGVPLSGRDWNDTLCDMRAVA